MLDTLLPLIVILSLAALIAVISFGVYRFLHPKMKEDKPTEDQFLQEELDRVLQPIEDEETAAQVNAYVDEEDQEDEEVVTRESKDEEE